MRRFIIFMAMMLAAAHAHAESIINDVEFNGGILQPDDYTSIVSSRLVDTHLVIDSSRHIAFVGDQLEGRTYLTVDGKDYVTAQEIEQETDRLSRAGKVTFHNMFLSVPAYHER